MSLAPALSFAQAPAAPPNASGPFVRMVRHNDGSRTVTARDASKREQEITTYDHEGELRLRRIYQLDRYGRAERFMIYDGQGTPLVRGEFTFDEFGRMIEERLFSVPDGKPIRTLRQTYDAQGKVQVPKVANHQPLPQELLYWMDPDSRQGTPPGGASGAVASQTQPPRNEREEGSKEKKERGGLFQRLRNRDR